MRGFFAKTELTTKAPPSLVPRCGECKLFESCLSPKIPVNGKGRKGILIIGEAPGEDEDKKGIPFVGRAGRLLSDALSKFGIDMRRDCWITNAVICRPTNNELKNHPKAIDHCRPNVLNAIRELKPEKIILLGASAIKSLIGWLWREDVGSVNRWIGWRIPCQKLNCWIAPAWHPAYILRGNAGKQDDTMQMLFEQHIEAALQLRGKPYPDGPPDYASKVRMELDDEKAANHLRLMIAFNKPVAFDYETDRLKPDREEAKIYSCAVSDGDSTIAFPWQGKVVEEMKVLLRSNVPKIIQNAKFEFRWTLAKLGIRMKNLIWDTMLAAHVLDNRSDSTGFKFQAFINLGVDPWDEVISPYLKAKGGANEPNRIKEVDLSTLLRYNGMDALLEWEVAQKQMALMKGEGQ